MKKLATLFFQLLVGGTFIFSGVSKCIDPMGSSIKIGEYLNHFSMPELAGWSMGMAWLLSLVEFAVGLCLFFGRNRRAALSMASLFMLVFTPLTLYLALANPVDDCGCFGDALVLSNWQTFWKNVVLFVALVWLVVFRDKIQRLLSASLFTFYFYGALVVVLVLCGLGTWRLPYIDFRPYRPGVNLRQEALQGKADGAAVDYVCIYQRGGELKEFPLEELPDEESGWEFVESREVVRDSSGESLTNHSDAGSLGGINWIESFFACDAEGEDKTAELLSDTSYVFLLISPSLGEASEHDVDRIEQLYEYALQQGYTFYCLTLHDPEQEDKWRYRTGAEYKMLYSDATVLETMIRANPGFMLLHDGEILWKTHLADLDVTRMTSAKLSEQTLGEVQPISRKNKVFWLVVWLIAPLLLYLPIQFIKNLITKHKTK